MWKQETEKEHNWRARGVMTIAFSIACAFFNSCVGLVLALVCVSSLGFGSSGSSGSGSEWSAAVAVVAGVQIFSWCVLAVATAMAWRQYPSSPWMTPFQQTSFTPTQASPTLAATSLALASSPATCVFDLAADVALVLSCLRMPQHPVEFWVKRNAATWVMGDRLLTRRFLYVNLWYAHLMAAGTIRVSLSRTTLKVMYVDTATRQMGEVSQNVLRTGIGLFSASALSTADALSAPNQTAFTDAPPKPLSKAYKPYPLEAMDSSAIGAMLFRTEMSGQDRAAAGATTFFVHGDPNCTCTLVIRLAARRLPVVLVLESDAVMGDRISRSLEPFGVKVCVMDPSTPQAAAATEDSVFLQVVSHIVLTLDVTCGTEDARDLCRRLRQMGFKGALVALRGFVSSSSSQDEEETGMSEIDTPDHLAKMGFDAVVARPVTDSSMRTFLHVMKNTAGLCSIKFFGCS